jgi:predicted ATPase/class 3 adenylate cyclase/Tfp pilus assembly protein PilF
MALREKLATDLPTGTVTFVLTDAVSSTRLWRLYPDQMRVACTRHDEIIDALVVAHHGRLVRPRGEGDSRFLVFTRASDALSAAAAMQRTLLAEPWPMPEPLMVRMAIHTGEADLRDGDYYGQAINRCARLRNATHGGQIVVSSVTASLAREHMPTDVGLRSLGQHRLQDLPEPDEIFQLLHADLPADFPPIKTLSASPHNLPLQLTSFIGRDQDLLDLRDRLLQRETRLLTLTGAAGAGKTRLAVRLAEEVLVDFPRGVFFVSLAPLADPELLTTTIGEAIGIREVPGQPLLTSLRDALKAPGLLLILDNFEHFMSKARQVGELVSACAGLKILITSREVLHLSAEQVAYVPTMAVPDPDLPVSSDRLTEFDSVRLFVERAEAADPSFSLTELNAPVIAQICARLDGLPLAIELAAARVKLLPPEALLERLSLTYDQRQSVLAGVDWDRPERHQAFRKAIDWSYGLLRSWEQRLFRRLGVFGGGFTLETAELLCADDVELDAGVLDGIGSLLDKSLVRQVGATAREPRYRMLETIRQYAMVQLQEAGELEAMHGILAGLLVRLAEQAEPELTGPQQVVWLNRLEQEHVNIRASLQWCLDNGEATLALRLAGALWRFWSTRGYVGEGLRVLDAAIANPNIPTSPMLARAINGVANLAREQGDYQRAQELHQRSLDLWRELGDKHGTAEALNNLGLIALYRGEHEHAQRRCEEGLTLFRELEDKGGVGAALNNLGNVARERGQAARAAALHGESLALRRAVGDTRGIALSLNNLANVVLNQGDYWRATALHQESLALRRQLGDRAGVATSLNNLGNVARVQGDLNAAREYYEQSLAVRRELGDKRRVAAALMNLGIVEREHGDRNRAAGLFRESLHLRRELGDQPGMHAALDNLRTLAGNQSDFAARVYHEESLAMRRELQDRAGIVAALTNLGHVARAQGDVHGARAYFEESLLIRREMGDKRGTAATLTQLGSLAVQYRDFSRAEVLLKQSVALHQEMDDRRGTAGALKHLASVATEQGDIQLARAFLGDCLTIYESLGDRRGRDECRARLTDMPLTNMFR